MKKLILLSSVFLVSTLAQADFADVNGIRLYYEVHGNGAPLVLIHGGGSTIESNWSQMLPLLKKKFQIIAIEEQGHGHSPAASRAFTFENSADDIAALLTHLKIEKASAFGFSNGGNIALRLALRHPAKVNKLVVASAMYRRDGMLPGFFDGMKKAKPSDMPLALREADQKINPDPKHLEGLFAQDSKRMKEFKDWPSKDLQSIHAPTLILIGDRDIVTADHAQKMTKLLPHARLAILPGNHGSFLGEVSSGKDVATSEVTAALVEAFLKD